MNADSNHFEFVVRPFNYVPWWLGMEGTCKNCGTVVKLKADVVQSALWNPGRDPLSSMELLCPTCNLVRIVFNREEKP